MTFFKYCEKSSRNIFLILSEVAETQSLKIDLYYFLGKIVLFLVLFWSFWAKRGQNRPKIRFFKCYEKSSDIFLILCMKLQLQKVLNLIHMIFLEISFLRFFVKFRKKLKLWRLRESRVKEEFAEGVNNKCDGNEDWYSLKRKLLDVASEVCG